MSSFGSQWLAIRKPEWSFSPSTAQPVPLAVANDPTNFISCCNTHSAARATCPSCRSFILNLSPGRGLESSSPPLLVLPEWRLQHSWPVLGHASFSSPHLALESIEALCKGYRMPRGWSRNRDEMWWKLISVVQVFASALLVSPRSLLCLEMCAPNAMSYQLIVPWLTFYNSVPSPYCD